MISAQRVSAPTTGEAIADCVAFFFYEEEKGSEHF